MKFKDGNTISAYVRSKLHSGYITIKVRDVVSPKAPLETASIVGKAMMEAIVLHLVKMFLMWEKEPFQICM